MEAEALIPHVGRLPGIDGKAKMSKSQGNAILLSAEPEAIREAVHRMYTDPGHLRASDPGIVEGNVVFTYLDAFDENEADVTELKTRYRRGGLGDMAVKRRLEAILQELLAPIRERRAVYARKPEYVLDVLREGTKNARAITGSTLAELRAGLELFMLD
jgi:tryptophanyl-tRNA synthetase